VPLETPARKGLVPELGCELLLGFVHYMARLLFVLSGLTATFRCIRALKQYVLELIVRPWTMACWLLHSTIPLLTT
jgi:hypothetical protein